MKPIYQALDKYSSHVLLLASVDGTPKDVDPDLDRCDQGSMPRPSRGSGMIRYTSQALNLSLHGFVRVCYGSRSVSL